MLKDWTQTKQLALRLHRDKGQSPLGSSPFRAERHPWVVLTRYLSTGK